MTAMPQLTAAYTPAEKAAATVEWAKGRIEEICAWTPEYAEESAVRIYESEMAGYRERLETRRLQGRTDPREDLFDPPPVRRSGEQFRQEALARMRKCAAYWTNNT